MQGRRIYNVPTSWAEDECPFQPGDFWVNGQGDWEGVSPNGLHCCLAKHHVAEHPDMSITVSPSIRVSDGQNEWHGYIERGFWRAC